MYSVTVRLNHTFARRGAITEKTHHMLGAADREIFIMHALGVGGQLAGGFLPVLRYCQRICHIQDHAHIWAADLIKRRAQVSGRYASILDS